VKQSLRGLREIGRIFDKHNRFFGGLLVCQSGHDNRHVMPQLREKLLKLGEHGHIVKSRVSVWFPCNWKN